ncbi:MAG: M28 family peptidase, partial [Planctomycetota bacterium]|jgi:N-acetylated-alpha-linked acidic dipeptidase
VHTTGDRLVVVALVLTTTCLAFLEEARATPPASLRWFVPEARDAQREYEAVLQSVPDKASLRRMHEALSSEPHVAGTAGDQRAIETLVEAYETLGLEVERHRIWAYLSFPMEAKVQVLRPGRQPISLPIREDVLPEDPYSSHHELMWGWNAYSGSGEATGEVVYANYGRKEDFQALADLGIDIEDRIVIARYGGNFRGFKAKFAEEAGAAALIIYTDPADSGYAKGPPYPEGGWANDSYIQRGSLKTLPYPGDPLTPFREATFDAPRVAPESLALPTIPVQPVGWRAAHEIMRRMQGEPLPRALRSSWQGGLPLSYRLTGGHGLLTRVIVRQQREIRPTANVLGMLRGSRYPEQTIVIGCHHDAWTFGAGDPNAGSIVVYEIARSFAEAARRGHRPARTLVFANWAAEEYGIIGSTEWVEANHESLARSAVAYINLDMAAMGPNFRSSAAPLLRTVIADAARTVPQVGDQDGGVIFERWAGDRPEGPSFGSLGGGSDHVGFYCHLGIPSCSFGAGGSDGVSYHSAYESLAWFDHVVGDDYGPATMITRVGAVAAARLANADVVPLDPTRYADDLHAHLEALSKRAATLNLEADLTPLRQAIDRLESAASRAVGDLHARLQQTPDDETLGRLNELSLTLERAWLHEPGLPERPWWRSLYAGTDPSSGYAAWPLPALRGAIESGDARAVAAAIELYAEALDRVHARVAAVAGR